MGRRIRGELIVARSQVKKSDEILRSGYDKFGANQFDVMKALERILTYLEANYGLVLGQDGGSPNGNGPQTHEET